MISTSREQDGTHKVVEQQNAWFVRGPGICIESTAHAPVSKGNREAVLGRDGIGQLSQALG